jgi:hypothetical protein
MSNNVCVIMQRSLLDHLVDGRLNTNEFAALCVLVLNADCHGSGRVNAPMLHATFLSDVSLNTCQRILANLEEKGYIRRGPIFGNKIAYQYWVNTERFSPGDEGNSDGE